MNPSPFETSRAVGTSLSRGIRQFETAEEEKRDASAIGGILRNAIDSKDPQALNSAMADIMSNVSARGQEKGMKALQGIADRMQKDELQKSKERIYTRDQNPKPSTRIWRNVAL